MTVLDLMAFLFYASVACLALAALDGLALLVMRIRHRRRINALLCACGAWPVDPDCPMFHAGWLHERQRCFPELET